jgi:hypothetical protein
VSVFDFLGKTIFYKHDVLLSLNGLTVIHPGLLPVGMYTIEISEKTQVVYNFVNAQLFKIKFL